MHPIFAGIEDGGAGIPPMPVLFGLGCVCFFGFVALSTAGMILLRRLMNRNR